MGMKMERRSLEAFVWRGAEWEEVGRVKEEMFAGKVGREGEGGGGGEG